LNIDCAVPQDTSDALERFVARMADEGLHGSIVAGHYSLAPDYAALSSDAAVEQRSFQQGIELAILSERLGAESRLVLWVNDIGIDVEERDALKRRYVLPIPYRRIADRLRFDPEKIEVVFESTMRNKGSTLIRRFEKRMPTLVRRVSAAAMGLIRCIEDEACDLESAGAGEAMVIAGPGGEDLVLKEGAHPKCCLILATLFRQLHAGDRGEYIANVFNGLYAARLAYGVHVARTLFQLRMPIHNAFIDESGLYSPTAAG